VVTTRADVDRADSCSITDGQPAGPPDRASKPPRGWRHSPGDTMAQTTLYVQISRMVILLLAIVVVDSSWSVASQAADPEKADALDVFFVVDNSGSMKKNDPRFITRKVVKDFSAALSGDSRVGMVIFDSDARLIEPLTSLKTEAQRRQFEASLQSVNFEGAYTNSPAGIERALYELKTKGRPKARKAVIFLTDGIIDTGDVVRDREQSRWLRDDLASESQEAGVRIFGVAFTESADVQLIQTLALKTNGEYFRAYQVEDIPGVLRKIIDIVDEPVEAVVAEAQPPAREKPSPAPSSPSESATGEDLTARAPDQVLDPPASPVPTVHPDERTPPSTEPAPRRPSTSSAADESDSWLSLRLALVLVALLVAVAIYLRKRNAAGSPSVAAAGGARLAPPKKSIPKAKLIDVMRASDEGVLPLTMDKSRLSVGRDPQNDIVINQGTVSSFHATIEVRGEYFFLEDHRSTNGTKLNEKPIDPNHPIQLKSGDHIEFADYEFCFLIPDHEASGKTVIMSVSSMKSDHGFSLVGDPEAAAGEQVPAVPAEPRDLLRECLTNHLGRIEELGEPCERFLKNHFGPEMIDRLVPMADDLMKRSTSGQKGCREVFAENGVVYVVCAIPHRMEDAAAWFGDHFGGFRSLLEQFLDSHHFIDGGCDVLCVVTYGRDGDGDVWVSVTIAPGNDSAEPIDIMSVEFLSEEERKVLALNFGEIGQIV
jgi:Mg-chelatase subunit ChlD